MDDTYKNFVTLVAKNRDKSFEELDAIAGGRVWSGKDALELGLIDMFGGLDKSIEVAASMAGLDTYRIESLPKLEDPLTTIMRELTGDAKMRAVKKELGEHYIHYKNLEAIKEMRGLQSIIPFEIELY